MSQNLYKCCNLIKNMDKAKHRVAISVSEEDTERLDELKTILNQKTYSKVIQQLIRFGKL